MAKKEVKPEAKPKKIPAKMGRPTKYCEELSDLICERLAISEDGLDTLCKAHDDMPHDETIRRWEYKYSDFSAKLKLARQHQQRHIVSSCKKDLSEVMTYIDAQGNVRIDAASVALQKAKVEHKHWQAARIDKGNFGTEKALEEIKVDQDEMKAELKAQRAILDEAAKKPY